jgi:amino acid transporter
MFLYILVLLTNEDFFFLQPADMSFIFLCFQPRILMAMARDGLLPKFFSDVNKHTQVPLKGTIVTGIGSAILAFLMDVSQLAGMVSSN